MPGRDQQPFEMPIAPFRQYGPPPRPEAGHRHVMISVTRDMSPFRLCECVAPRPTRGIRDRRSSTAPTVDATARSP